jgi:hypothetical protein
MTIERPMFPPRAGATKEEAWHRRHALQVACSLPDSPEDSPDHSQAGNAARD